MDKLENMAKEYANSIYPVFVKQATITKPGNKIQAAYLAGALNALSNQWRKAKEEQPADMQKCLCYDKGMRAHRIYVYYDKDKYWCDQDTAEHDPNGDNHVSDYADYRITHWMPIPDMPI